MQESEKILGRFPGPVRLYPSRLRVAGLMLLSVGGAVILGFYVSGDYTHPIGAYATFMSWFSLVALAAVAVGLLFQLLFPKIAVCLILDAEGFEIHRFAKSEYVRWRDVRGFDTRKQWVGKGTIEQVVFKMADGGGVLPNNYGLGLQDLLQLMEAWRKRATAGKSGGQR